MQTWERSRSELHLASKPDSVLRMLAIFFFALILIPFGVSGFEGYSGGLWLVYLLLLAVPAFFWQQDVRTSRIRFDCPTGNITVTYTPLWSTFIPGAAYAVKRTVRLPMPRADPRVETWPGSYADPLGGSVHEVLPWSFCSVSVPTAQGGIFRLYRGRHRSTADDIVARIRWARQDLIRRGRLPAAPQPQPFPARRRSCLHCNRPVRLQDQFCQSCGRALPDPAPARTAPDWVQAPPVQDGLSSPRETKRPYLLGSLVTSLLGAIALLFGDIGGWEERRHLGMGSYGFREAGIGLLDHVFFFLAIGTLAVLLLYTTRAALRSLPLGGEPVDRSGLLPGFWTATCAVVGTLVGGMVFIVAMGRLEPVDWWLDWGFYGGAIGGGLAALLLRLDLRSG